MEQYYSKIGLGSVQFGIDYGIANNQGQTSSKEVSKILDFASQSGVSYVDTASAYGTAEEVLGRNRVNRFNIVSKFMPASIGIAVSEQFQASCTKLAVSDLYAYLAHRPLDLIKERSSWSFLQSEKEKGRINKIGFSLNNPEELRQLATAGIEPDLIQVPYNFFDNRFRKQLIELKNRGCEIHTRSTFLQGLFFMPPNSLPPFFDEVKGQMYNLQEEYGSGLAASLLKYVLDQEFVDVVIVGVNNVTQLKENLERLKAAQAMKDITLQIDENILMPSEWPSR